VKSIPVRRDDEVLVKSGHFKGREGKIVEVYRKKWAVYVDKVQREKANGIISSLLCACGCVSLPCQHKMHLIYFLPPSHYIHRNHRERAIECQ
jgi:hypothetical protein